MTCGQITATQAILSYLSSVCCSYESSLEEAHALFSADEAHKGTGDYAYAQVVRYMMAKNPNFRVLALTATPGGKPDAVQAIVDALHISHIEIRDEQSLDLAPYLHKKHIKKHIISMTEDVLKVRDLLSEVMTVSVLNALPQYTWWS